MPVATALVLAGLQTVLRLEVEGEGPVRIGVPLPATALARGLHLQAEPGAAMQWAPLQEHPGHESDRIWVELLIHGAHGTVRVAAGGAGPEREGGAACRVVRTEEGDDVARRRSTTWTWADGTVESKTRDLWLVSDEQSGVVAGEAITIVPASFVERRTRARVSPSEWRDLGVLPRARAPGESGLRDELLALLQALPAAPGTRGRGDYVRGGDVVTNLEFDTVLGLVRLALATGDRDALRRAWESARHLVDRDIELGSGLPYRHGRDHRSARPELGHVWLRGLLLTGCTFAERDLIDAARSIARALAARVRSEPPREGLADRMRDEAWPLWELEEYLRFEDVPPVREAADAVADRMLDRWVASLGVLRYGEAETRGESLRDRLWLSAGIAAPALRRYSERTGDRRARSVASAIEHRAASLMRSGRAGVPVSCMVSSRGVFGETFVEAAAEGALLIDGLSPRTQRRLLPRVRDALSGALDPEADDLATRWTIVARCEWILR